MGYERFARINHGVSRRWSCRSGSSNARFDYPGAGDSLGDPATLSVRQLAPLIKESIAWMRERSVWRGNCSYRLSHRAHAGREVGGHHLVQLALSCKA